MPYKNQTRSSTLLYSTAQESVKNACMHTFKDGFELVRGFGVTSYLLCFCLARMKNKDPLPHGSAN